MYRKPSAGNTYTHWKSAHDEKVKTGLVRGELIRYLRLCSTENTFQKAWRRFRGHLEQRGYPSRWQEKAGGDLEWRNRSEIMKRLDERREQRGASGGRETRHRMSWWYCLLNQGYESGGRNVGR